MQESEQEEFLAPITTEEKVAVGNLSLGIYTALIMEKQAHSTAAARVIDPYLKQNPWLSNSLEILRRLSIAELQRLGMSVKAAQEGIAAHSRGDLAEARRLLEESCQHNPYNADAWCSLGVVVADAGDHVEGVRLAKKALSLDPGNQAARSSLKAMEGHQ